MKTKPATTKAPAMKLSITSNDIAIACPKNSKHCMIARAVRRTFKGGKRAIYLSVDLQTVRFTDSKTGERFVYLTPRPAQKQLLKFDLGEAVNPFISTLSNGTIEKREMKRQKTDVSKATTSVKKKKAARRSKAKVSIVRGHGLCLYQG